MSSSRRATLINSLRRMRDRVRAVGFCRVGIVYTTRAPVALAVSASESGMMPSSSIATGASEKPRYRAMAFMPLNVNSSVRTTSPGLHSALNTRSMDACAPPVMMTREGSRLSTPAV